MFMEDTGNCASDDRTDGTAAVDQPGRSGGALTRAEINRRGAANQ